MYKVIWPSFLVFVCLCVSCSSQQKYSLTRITTPEVAGAHRFDLSLTEAIRLRPSSNLGATNVDSDATLSSTVALNAMNAFGMTDFFDIEASWGPEQTFLTALKLQFFGAPTSSAGQGNISLALRLGYGLLVGGGKISRSELSDRRLAERSYIIESGYGVLDLIAGYRVLAPLLLYIGIFRDDGRYALSFKKGIKTKLVHPVNGSGISFGSQYQMGNLLFQIYGAKGRFELPESQKEKSQLDLGLSLGLLY